MQQLKSSSLISYINLIRCGYPKRVPIDQIYKSFKPKYNLWKDVCSDSKRFCSNLLLSNGFKHTDFKFGTDCIFFRMRCSTLLDKLSYPNPDFIGQSINTMKKHLIQLEWKKLYEKALIAQGVCFM